MVKPAEHGNSLDARMHLGRASDGLLLSEDLNLALSCCESSRGYATQRISMMGGLLASNIRTRRLSAN
jgi:hypothetical protein